MMAMPRHGCMFVRCGSLETISSAIAVSDRARNMLSFGSGQSVTTCVTSTMVT